MKHDFIKINENVYYLTANEETDRPNLGYVVGSKGAVMFDAGTSPSHINTYYAFLDKYNLPHPKFCVLSHFHWDHSMGMKALNIPVIANAKTNALLKERVSWPWTLKDMEAREVEGLEIDFCNKMMVKEYGSAESILGFRPCDIEFERTLNIALGDITCTALHITAPHSIDSTVLLVNEPGVLFLGDCAGNDLGAVRWKYDINNPQKSWDEADKIPYDKTKLKALTDTVSKLNCACVLSGHGSLTDKQGFINKLISKL